MAPLLRRRSPHRIQVRGKRWGFLFFPGIFFAHNCLAYYYEKTFVAGPKRPHLTATQRQMAEARVAPDILEVQENDGLLDEDKPTLMARVANLGKKVTSCCGHRGGGENGGAGGDEDLVEGTKKSKKKKKVPVKKYGMWDGVVAPCLLNTFGVVMFLRVPWIVGNCGIWQSVLIVLVATLLLLITAMSMAAVASNGKMKGGGAYYMISRNLGPQFGGAIGLLFAVGQAIAISFYLIGFAEALDATLIADYSFSLTGDALWNARVYAILALVVLLVMVLIGVGWIIKSQMILLAALVLVVVSIVIGTIVGPMAYENEIAGNTTAFVGFNGAVAANNTNPDFLPGQDFFTVFAIFFPAMTGLLAGANMSGDLRDPGKDIAYGTFISVAIASLVYILLLCLCGTAVTRTQDDGTGGLYFDSLIMGDMTLWYPLILIGVFAATLSSGLAGLSGAPRVAQAWAKDKIFVGSCIEPVERALAYGRKGTNDPVVGYFVTFLVALGFCMIGDVNSIAPIITQIFLVTFGLMNASCFLSDVSKTPGWRPSYQLYNPWISLLGTVFCVVAMFLLSWWAALLTVGIGGALLILQYARPPNVSWGPSGQAYQITKAVEQARNLRKIPFHAKTWRPHVLVLVKSVQEDEKLIVFSYHFTAGGGGLNLCGQVVLGEFRQMLPLHSLENAEGFRSLHFDMSKLVRGSLKTVSIKYTVFWEVVIAESLRKGVQNMCFSSGLGKLRPNTTMIAYPEGWRQESAAHLAEYMDIVRDIMEVGNNCMLVRGAERLSLTGPLPKGTVDVWWLVDDGGFSILMPWLLISQKFWGGCRLRIFTVPGNTSLDAVASLAANFQRMVEEFRIDAEVRVELPDEMDDSEYDRILERVDITVPPEERERMMRYFRLSKLMQTASSSAVLLFATLPFPRDEIPCNVWFTWLEAISNAHIFFDNDAVMPPITFLRGNQQSLLSIYM